MVLSGSVARILAAIVSACSAAVPLIVSALFAACSSLFSVYDHIDFTPFFSFVPSFISPSSLTPPPSPSPLSFDSRLHPVYCVTSPAKDERYRAPPPTPPGYQGLALGDLGIADGVVSGPGGLGPRPPHLRPPDYSVALQRSKLLQSPGASGSLAEARRLAANRLLQHQEDRSSGSTQGHSRPASICLPAQDLADSDDGTPAFTALVCVAIAGLSSGVFFYVFSNT